MLKTSKSEVILAPRGEAGAGREAGRGEVRQGEAGEVGPGGVGPFFLRWSAPSSEKHAPDRIVFTVFCL